MTHPFFHRPVAETHDGHRIPAPHAQGQGRALYGQVVGLCAAAGEGDLAAATPQNRGDGVAGLVVADSLDAGS